MPLNKQEQILYNTVKKLTGKLIHQCRLRHADENELIQAGCLACLEAKAKPQDYNEIAKKAILKCYYKEANIQKKQVTDIKIGKADEDHKKNLVEEVLPAKEQLSDEERQEADKQQGLEWEDLPPDLPEDVKNDILAYRDHGIKGYLWTKAFKEQAYKHRKLTVAHCQEVIQGNNAVFQYDLSRNMQNLKKGYAVYSPYTNYILRKLKWNNTKENKHIVRYSLNCPLIRNILERMEPNFPIHAPIQKGFQRAAFARKIQKANLTNEQILLYNIDKVKATYGWARIKAPYAKYIATKLHMPIETATLAEIKQGLSCPLVRKQLKKIDADLDRHCEYKPIWSSTKVYNKFYFQQLHAKAKKYKLKNIPITRKIINSKCPIIKNVLENGLLIKHHVKLARNLNTDIRLNMIEAKKQELAKQHPTLTDNELKILAKQLYIKENTSKITTNRKQPSDKYLLLQKQIQEQYHALGQKEQEVILKKEWKRQKQRETYQKNKAILASVLAKIQQHGA